MSIFDNTFESCNWNCIHATKNINTHFDKKDVIVNLTYRNGSKYAEIGATYTINYGGKISRDVVAKMFVRIGEIGQSDKELKRSLSARQPHEFTDVMIMDFNFVNALFEQASADVKRVYL